MRRITTVAAGLCLAVAVGMCTTAIAAGPTIIVDQADSPLKLQDYRAGYQEGSTGRFASREGIVHTINYLNASGRPIVALKIGFVSFDYFNDLIGKMNGIAIETIAPATSNPNVGRENGRWIQRARSDFAFLTGVAFVQQVRFEDGEVWTADLDVVVAEVEKIEADFNRAVLEGEDDDEE